MLALLCNLSYGTDFVIPFPEEEEMSNLITVDGSKNITVGSWVVIHNNSGMTKIPNPAMLVYEVNGEYIGVLDYTNLISLIDKDGELDLNWDEAEDSCSSGIYDTYLENIPHFKRRYRWLIEYKKELRSEAVKKQVKANQVAADIASTYSGHVLETSKVLNSMPTFCPK